MAEQPDKINRAANNTAAPNNLRRGRSETFTGD
jgi:hypothetical protein